MFSKVVCWRLWETLKEDILIYALYRFGKKGLHQLSIRVVKCKGFLKNSWKLTSKAVNFDSFELKFNWKILVFLCTCQIKHHIWYYRRYVTTWHLVTIWKQVVSIKPYHIIMNNLSFSHNLFNFILLYFYLQRFFMF